MSKFRPQNSNCKDCGGVGTVIAGYWHKGSYIIVDGRKKRDTIGHWVVSCTKCGVR